MNFEFRPVGEWGGDSASTLIAAAGTFNTIFGQTFARSVFFFLLLLCFDPHLLNLGESLDLAVVSYPVGTGCPDLVRYAFFPPSKK